MNFPIMFNCNTAKRQGAGIVLVDKSYEKN